MQLLDRPLQRVLARLGCCAFVTAIGAIAACAASEHRSLPAEWDILPASYARRSAERATSASVVLIADNQLHNVYSEPAGLLRTGLTDRFVGTSIRPPQLDLFGQDLLRAALEEQPDKAVIHLGDAADLSCQGEFLEFCSIMDSVEMPWALAPGNHDGFLFGSDYRDPEGDLWTAACANSGGALTKSDLVRIYLAAVLGQDLPERQSLAAAMGLAGVERRPDESIEAFVQRIHGAIAGRGAWRADPDTDPGFFRAVSWRIDEERTWESFVVQWVDLTGNPDAAFPVGAILLDTSNHSRKPSLLPISLNPGSTGAISQEQGNEVREWTTGSGAAATWAFMGHHPYEALNDESRELLDDLRAGSQARLYVSAHTHSGHYEVHGRDDDDRPPDLSDPDAWLELNIGSVIDWPQEYRLLSFFRFSDAQTEGEPLRTGFRSERLELRTTLESQIGNAPWSEWLPAPGEPDYSLRYARLSSLSATDAEQELKTGLLGLHRRMIALFETDLSSADPIPWPAGVSSDAEVIAAIDALIEDSELDEKVGFLLQLREFEEGRPLTRALDRKRARFRLALAVIASRFEFRRARLPLPDDWVIVFPAEVE